MSYPESNNLLAQEQADTDSARCFTSQRMMYATLPIHKVCLGKICITGIIVGGRSVQQCSCQQILAIQADQCILFVTVTELNTTLAS